MKSCLVVMFIALCVYQQSVSGGKLALEYGQDQNQEMSKKTQDTSDSGTAVFDHLFDLTKRCFTKRCLDKREENSKLNKMANRLRSVGHSYQQDAQLRPPCLKGRCPEGDTAADQPAKRFIEPQDFELPRIQRALRPPCFKGRCRQLQAIRDSE